MNKIENKIFLWPKTYRSYTSNFKYSNNAVSEFYSLSSAGDNIIPAMAEEEILRNTCQLFGLPLSHRASQ